MDVELEFRIVEAEAPPAVLQLPSLPYIMWVGGMVRDRGSDSRLHLGRMHEFGRIPAWKRRKDLGRDTAWKSSRGAVINFGRTYHSCWDEAWF